VSPLGPTYWPSHSNRNPDILDFFITNIPNHLNTDISNICHISSDHTPVTLSIGGSPKQNDRPSLTKGPIAWDLFKTNLDNLIDLRVSLKTQDQVENAAQNLVEIIKKSSYFLNQNYPRQFTTSKHSPIQPTTLFKQKKKCKIYMAKFSSPQRQKNIQSPVKSS